MANKKRLKKRNALVQIHIERQGAGSGPHKNRTKRATQVPRKRKHKGKIDE